MQSSDRQGRRHRDLTRSPPVGYKDSLPRVRQSPSVVPCHRDTFLFRLLSSVHVRFGCDLPVQVGTLSLARYLLCVCVCAKCTQTLPAVSSLERSNLPRRRSVVVCRSKFRPPARLPACLPATTVCNSRLWKKEKKERRLCEGAGAYYKATITGSEDKKFGVANCLGRACATVHLCSVAGSVKS